MINQTILFIRLYSQSLILFVFGFLLILFSHYFISNIYLHQLAETFEWVPLIFIGLGFISACWVTFRAWQAEKGIGLTCDKCAGPLGRELDGRFNQYRKCMACFNTMSENKYS